MQYYYLIFNYGSGAQKSIEIAVANPQAGKNYNPPSPGSNWGETLKIIGICAGVALVVCGVCTFCFYRINKKKGDEDYERLDDSSSNFAVKRAKILDNDDL